MWFSEDHLPRVVQTDTSSYTLVGCQEGCNIPENLENRLDIEIFSDPCTGLAQQQECESTKTIYRQDIPIGLDLSDLNINQQNCVWINNSSCELPPDFPSENLPVKNLRGNSLKYRCRIAPLPRDRISPIGTGYGSEHERGSVYTSSCDVAGADFIIPEDQCTKNCSSPENTTGYITTFDPLGINYGELASLPYSGIGDIMEDRMSLRCDEGYYGERGGVGWNRDECNIIDPSYTGHINIFGCNKNCDPPISDTQWDIRPDNILADPYNIGVQSNFNPGTSFFPVATCADGYTGEILSETCSGVLDTRGNTYYKMNGCFPSCDESTDECLNITVNYDYNTEIPTVNEFKQQIIDSINTSSANNISQDNISFLRKIDYHVPGRSDATQFDRIVEYQIKCPIGECDIVEGNTQSWFLGPIVAEDAEISTTTCNYICGVQGLSCQDEGGGHTWGAVDEAGFRSALQDAGENVGELCRTEEHCTGYGINRICHDPIENESARMSPYIQLAGESNARCLFNSGAVTSEKSKCDAWHRTGDTIRRLCKCV